MSIDAGNMYIYRKDENQLLLLETSEQRKSVRVGNIMYIQLVYKKYNNIFNILSNKK